MLAGWALNQLSRYQHCFPKAPAHPPLVLGRPSAASSMSRATFALFLRLRLSCFVQPDRAPIARHPQSVGRLFWMLWAMIVAGGTGFALGLRLRVAAVLAVSGGIVVACIVLAPLLDWTPFIAAISVLGMLLALQIGYLAGLAVYAVRFPGAGSPPSEEPRARDAHHIRRHDAEES